MLNFNNTVEIFLPQEDNDKKPISWARSLETVGRAIGGYTVFNAGIVGSWWDAGKEYTDRHNVLRLDFKRLGNREAQAVRELLGEAFKTQISMFLSVNGRSLILEAGDIENLMNYLKTL